VLHGAQSGADAAKSAAESAEHAAQNGSAARAWDEVVHEAHGAANKTESAAESAAHQLQDGSAARAWNGVVHDAQSAANKTAATVKSATHQLQDGVVHEAKSVANETESAAESAAHRLQTGSGVAKTAERDLDAAGAAAARAARAAEGKMKALGAAVDNYTYTISPFCGNALEVGAVVAAGIVASPALLEAAGFGAEGVAGDSLASTWQSVVGDVETGSLFARLQSLGARGVLQTASIRAVGVEAVAASAYCAAAQELREQEPSLAGRTELQSPLA